MGGIGAEGDEYEPLDLDNVTAYYFNSTTSDLDMILHLIQILVGYSQKNQKKWLN